MARAAVLAGAPDPQPFWQVTPGGFRDVLETKVTGCFLMAREVVPLMIAQGGGRPGGDGAADRLARFPPGRRRA